MDYFCKRKQQSEYSGDYFGIVLQVFISVFPGYVFPMNFYFVNFVVNLVAISCLI